MLLPGRGCLSCPTSHDVPHRAQLPRIAYSPWTPLSAFSLSLPP